jgi:hypothetical protein
MNDAEAPKAINIEENPITKNTVLRITRVKWREVLLRSVNSSNDTPDIKEIYPGIRGRTQGDTKERAPARKALKYPTLVSNIKSSVNILVG